MDKKTKKQYQQYRQVFCNIRTVTELCHLLRTDKRKLELLAQQPPYKSFTVPKKDGGERLIEAPGPDLKRLLGRLNRYLQSVYFFEKSNAAYGFILGVKNDDDRRNVLTNAQKHCNQPYLLNIDLKDFFHAVNRETVLQIFTGPPFNFKRQVPELLADLVTYQGRLPMGSPTSPVLSNFACRPLDEALVLMSTDLLWTYTRYADDLSFSSKRYINAEMVNTIIAEIKKTGFAVNARKIKNYGPDDPKIITGLLVSDKVTLAPDYIPQLRREIEQLADIFRAQNEQGELHTKWVDQFRQQVRGRLNFAGFILKRNDETYMELRDAFFTAIHPPKDEFGAISYRGFPYNM